MKGPETHACFAVTAPGLAPIAAAELATLGLSETKTEAGGVRFHASLQDLYRMNLHAATCSRLLLRFAEFRTTSFPQLERLASRLPWDQWITPGRPVVLRVTCRKSRLYHSDAVAERISRVMGHDAASIDVAEGSDESTDPASGQLIVVRLDHDVCTISIDSSGDLLHRRGYRLALGKAPLRETLAAAALASVGWDGTVPLVDPFCGSGTIAIEAARRARGIAPGSGRRFAFELWPGFDADVWERVRAEGLKLQRDRCPVAIAAYDRDPGAIEAARANAERAGVASDIEFEELPVSRARPTGGSGWLVTNPPYGHRASEGTDLRDLYARFGAVVRERFAGWSVAVLAAEARLVGHAKLGLGSRLRTTNGGIPVGLYVSK